MKLHLLAILACTIPLAGSDELSIHTEDGVGEIYYDYVVSDYSAIKILYEDSSGEAIRTFQRLAQHGEVAGLNILASMNGGIFEPDEVPTGLMIQDKKVISPLNLNDGKGNFFLKPNGVFYVTQDEAKIVESSLYNNKEEVYYATQSGPLLVSNGEIHSSFNKGSKSRRLRNGVGIMEDGRVILAISKKSSKRQPNLHEFASFFISKGCKQALYLDGVISELRIASAFKGKGRDYSSFIVIDSQIADKSE